MTDVDALGMLRLIKAEPTLLQQAPDTGTGVDIERRRQDEVHDCLGCGARATRACIALTSIGPRWLDLCEACAVAVHDANDSREWPR